MMKIAPVRKVVRRSHMGFVGWFHSRKHGKVAYESHLERDFVRLMEVDPQVTRLRAQPRWIKWWDPDGVCHDHCPDFAFERCGTSVIAEVKYANVFESPKTDADRLVCIRTPIVTAQFQDEGILYRALTERFIRRQPALANAMFLLKGIHCDPTESEVAEVKKLLVSHPAGIALGRISVVLLRPLEFVNEVLAMIMDGHVRLASPDKPASLDSPVLLGRMP